MKRILGLCAGVLAIALAMSGCGHSAEVSRVGETWNDIVEAAQAEGSVTYYTSGDEERAAELGSRFEEEYGIPVTVVYRTSNELSKRIDAEARSGRHVADLVNIAELPLLVELAEDGDLEELQGPHTAAAGDALESPYVANVSTTYFAVMYSDRLQGPPDEWSEILAPELDGRAGLRGMEGSTVNTLAYHWLNTNQNGFLETLGQQSPLFTQSLATSVPMLEGGQVDLVWPVVGWFAVSQANELDDVEAVIPSPALAYGRYSSVMKGASNPNAAILLNDFLLSCEGQEYINGDGLGTSPNCELDSAIPRQDTEIDLWAGIKDVFAEVEPTLTDYQSYVQN